MANRVMVCMLVSQLPVAPVSSMKRTCNLCASAIWVAQSSPPADEYLCMPWAEALNDGIPESEPLTPGQMADIMKVIGN
jgi:hypothetical protein